MVKGLFCFVRVGAFAAHATALPYRQGPQSVCAAPWTQLSTGCYRFHESPMTQSEAKKFCEEEQAMYLECLAQSDYCNVLMSDIKYIYFDLRVKGEPARLLLAHGGVKYTDERIELGWNDPKPWTELKPSMPWGQLPMLQWKGESICQSMAICR